VPTVIRGDRGARRAGPFATVTSRLALGALAMGTLACPARNVPTDGASDVAATIDADHDADATPDAAPDGAPRRVPRMLVLDSELRHASGWVDVLGNAAGRSPVEATYRRFFPHMTSRDVTPMGTSTSLPFDIVVLAAGRGPTAPTSMYRADEIALARSFVERGGVLVLAPQAGFADSPTGDNEFFVFNRVLEELHVAIRIEKNTLLGDAWVGASRPAHEPSMWAYPTGIEESVGYAYLQPSDGVSFPGGSIPAGLVPTLRVGGDDVHVLLRTFANEGYLWQRRAGDPATRVVTVVGERPVAAIASAGAGYVAVVPRDTLTLSGASGTLSTTPVTDDAANARSAAWVTGLLSLLGELALHERSLSRGPAVDVDPMFSVAAPGWDALEPAGEVIRLRSAPRARAVPDAPPEGILNETAVDDGMPPPRIAWFDPRGRVGYGSLPSDPARVRSLFADARAHRLNAVMTTTNPHNLLSLTGSALDAEQQRYRDAGNAAMSEGVHLYVGGYFDHLFRQTSPRAFPRMVGANGLEVDAPDPIDDGFWTAQVISQCDAVARATAGSGVTGMHFDMELYGGPIVHQDGYAFSAGDVRAWQAAGGDAMLAAQWLAAAASERLDLIVDRGVLGDYFSRLTGVATSLATRCRDAARAVNPALEFMLYVPAFPNTWFYRGMIRGLGTRERPVIVLTYDGWSRRATRILQSAGDPLVHLGGVIVGHYTPDTFGRALTALSRGTDGFWFFTADDIATGNPMRPALHGTADAYWRAIDGVN